MKIENTQKGNGTYAKVCFFSLIGIFALIPPLAIFLVLFILIHYIILGVENSYLKGNLSIPSKE